MNYIIRMQNATFTFFETCIGQKLQLHCLPFHVSVITLKYSTVLLKNTKLNLDDSTLPHVAVK